MDPLIGNLATTPEGDCDWKLLDALHDSISLDRALDIAEVREVARSWHDATRANGRLQQRGFG